MIAHQSKVQQATEIDLSNASLSPSELLYASIANQMSVDQLLRSYGDNFQSVPQSLRGIFEQRTQELAQIVVTGADLLKDTLGLGQAGTDKLKSLQDGTLSNLAQALGIDGADLARFNALTKEKRADLLHVALNTQLNNPDTVLEVMAALAGSRDPSLDSTRQALLERMTLVALDDLNMLRLLTMRTLEAEAQRAAGGSGPSSQGLVGGGTVSAMNAYPSLQSLLSIAENAEKLKDLVIVGIAIAGAVQTALRESKLDYLRAEIRTRKSEHQGTLDMARAARNEEASHRYRGSPEANQHEFKADNLETYARNREQLVNALSEELRKMEERQSGEMAFAC